MIQSPLDTSCASGVFVGRAWRPDAGGPSVVVVIDDRVVDITSPQITTMSDLIEQDDPVAVALGSEGKDIGSLEGLARNGLESNRDPALPWLLAPCDLQAIKACGVTFARSLLERVIEEKTGGDPKQAIAMRDKVVALIGDRIRDLKPGSDDAARVAELLKREGLWSQYLEVGIGPDAEVFTKAQPMSAVGWGASVGVPRSSQWNNPEPEIVLAVDSRARVRGVALGNDVNLRDVEGRSALLLGKAKDNNASCAIGPFIRLFDGQFGMEDVRTAVLSLTIQGEDGYRLEDESRMVEISRDPLDLVAQAIGPLHQYPDGLMLFTGTLFAPVEDRNAAGMGFTHKTGDIVRIAAHGIGSLENTVMPSAECPPWSFGISALMRNLAKRALLTGE